MSTSARTEQDTLEANKALARRYFDVINTRRLEDLDGLVAEDAVDAARPAENSGGREDFRRHALWLWDAVEEPKVTVTDLVAEGDQVVAYWRLEGIHRGEIFGVPGTGRTFSGVSISTLTIRGGRIVHYTVLPDRLGFVQQFGADVR